MSRCTTPRSSARDAVRVFHPGIMKPCVDQDSLSLSCPGFVTATGRYSPQPALEARYLGDSCQTSVLVGSVKNCLPLILFPGLAASNSSVCPQLPMESPSVAAGWAELGRVGLRRPHTGTSVRAGSCHVSFGG